MRGLANKLPEHATRLAAVLTLVDDIAATEVQPAEMEAGIALAEHYVGEAMRLFDASQVHSDLLLAQRLLAWLRTSWTENYVSLPDIYQRSLNAILSIGEVWRRWWRRTSGGGARVRCGPTVAGLFDASRSPPATPARG